MRLLLKVTGLLCICDISGVFPPPLAISLSLRSAHATALGAILLQPVLPASCTFNGAVAYMVRCVCIYRSEL